MTKKLSLEEQREKERDRVTNVKTTLESKLIHSAIGGNEVKANPYLYGQLGLSGGEQTYADAMGGEEANRVRDELYKEKQAERNKLGIAEEAPYATNYDVVSRLKKQLGEVQAIAKIGELEKYAKDAGANLDFEVPEDLKDYSQADLFQKAVNEEGKIDLNKLNEKERDAFQMQQVLTQSYERAIGLKAAQTNYFADLGSVGKQIANKYKKADSD